MFQAELDEELMRINDVCKYNLLRLMIYMERCNSISTLWLNDN